MKWKLLCLLAAATLCLGAAALIENPFRVIIKTVADIAVPEVASDSTRQYHSITFLGMKAGRTNNTDKVWLQNTSTNDSGGYPLSPGEKVTFTKDDRGPYLKPSEFWIDVEVAGDGVVMLLFP